MSLIVVCCEEEEKRAGQMDRGGAARSGGIHSE